MLDQFYPSTEPMRHLQRQIIPQTFQLTNQLKFGGHPGIERWCLFFQRKNYEFRFMNLKYRLETKKRLGESSFYMPILQRG